jgi:threonyl-tRNA synthetase
MRVRGFTQDDAHIFCRPDQLADEVRKVLKFTTFMLGAFGFNEFKMYLSTRPEKAVGSLDQWGQATQALEGALKEGGYAPRLMSKFKMPLDGPGNAPPCKSISIIRNDLG